MSTPDIFAGKFGFYNQEIFKCIVGLRDVFEGMFYQTWIIISGEIFSFDLFQPEFRKKVDKISCIIPETEFTVKLYNWFRF